MKRVMLLMCLAAALAGPLAGAARPKTAQELLSASINRPAATVTLTAALADLEQRAGLKIRVDWPSLLEAGVKDDAKLTFTAADATLIQLLDSTLAQAAPKGKPLAWYLADDAIMITTQQRVLAQKGMPAPLAVAPTRSGGGDAPPLVSHAQAPPKKVTFDKKPLAEVIDYIRRGADVNFHVQYGALKAVGITEDTPISLELSDVSMARLLDLVMDLLSQNKNKFDSVYWVVNEGVVSISTGTAFNNSSSVRIYDVSDMLHAMPNFQGPKISLDAMSPTGVGAGSGSGGGSSVGGGTIFNNAATVAPGDQAPGKTRAAMEEKLIKMVKNAIGEDMWLPNGQGDVQIWNGKMVISQTPLGFKLLEKTAGVH